MENRQYFFFLPQVVVKLIISIQCGYVLRGRHNSTFCGLGEFNRVSPPLLNFYHATGVMLSAFLQQSHVLQQPCVADFILPILQTTKLELRLSNRLSDIGTKNQSWDSKVSPVLFFFFQQIISNFLRTNAPRNQAMLSALNTIVGYKSAYSFATGPMIKSFHLYCLL